MFYLEILTCLPLLGQFLRLLPFLSQKLLYASFPLPTKYIDLVLQTFQLDLQTDFYCQ